jgi:Chaperone of endosialidase
VKFICLILFLLSFQILKGQNLGIGTTTPTRAQLEVVGVSGTGNTSAIFGNGLTGISFQQNWPSVGFNQYRDAAAGNGRYMENGYAALWYQDPNTGTIAMDMIGSGLAGTTTLNPVRALSILNNGHVGIQTPTPVAGLAVGRGTGLDGTAVFAGSQHWSHFNYATNEDTYIRSGREGGKLYINRIPNGKVFLGSGNSKITIGSPGIAPTATITITGISGRYFGLANILTGQYNHYWDMRLNFINAGPTGYDLEFYYQNIRKTAFHYNSGLLVGVSDRNAKEDIHTLDQVLEKVNQLRPVSYKMIDQNPAHKRSLGFIAQEVKELFPQLVMIANDQSLSRPVYKDLHTMNYSHMHVIAIKALQEQFIQIQKLRQERETLMNELKSLARELGIK